MKIRTARKADARQLLAIYTPFITDSAVSFEARVPSTSEFQSRIANYMAKYPWLVCEHKGKLIGYAYASGYRDRIAYQWSCECSVYIDKKFKRKGIARALYDALFEILTCQGFVNAYAVITHPNPASAKFHRTIGFKLFAIYKNAGYKLGKWHDVHWYSKRINGYKSHPENPKPLSTVCMRTAVKNILNKHNQDITSYSSTNG